MLVPVRLIEKRSIPVVLPVLCIAIKKRKTREVNTVLELVTDNQSLRPMTLKHF